MSEFLRSLYNLARKYAQQFAAAWEYISAIEALPPTYDYFEGMPITQVFPDPVDQASIQRALDRVKRAEANWKACAQQNNLH